MRESENEDVELLWGGETPGAIKVRADEDDSWEFLPKSLVVYVRRFARGPNGLEDRVSVSAPQWLLEKKGLC